MSLNNPEQSTEQRNKIMKIFLYSFMAPFTVVSLFLTIISCAPRIYLKTESAKVTEIQERILSYFMGGDIVTTSKPLQFSIKKMPSILSRYMHLNLITK